MSPPVPLNQEISHGAAARPSLKMIHWIIFRALRPSWTSLRDKLAAIVLLARRLKTASPDALHPGKAWENPRGKASFPPRIFPGFLRARSPLTFVPPSKWRTLPYFTYGLCSPGTGPGGLPPWRRSGGAQPPAFPFAGFMMPSLNMTVHAFVFHA